MGTLKNDEIIIDGGKIRILRSGSDAGGFAAVATKGSPTYSISCSDNTNGWLDSSDSAIPHFITFNSPISAKLIEPVGPTV